MVTNLPSDTSMTPEVPPLSPRRSPREKKSTVFHHEVLSTGSSAAVGSSKRKSPDSPPETPRLAKARRVASSGSPGSQESHKSVDQVEASLKNDKGKGKQPKKTKISKVSDTKRKQALWFKLDVAHFSTAWPLVGSADAAACETPKIGKPRDITPVRLEQFDLQTILNSKFFQNDFGFVGLQDLRKAYEFIAPLVSAKSDYWNEGVASLVFLACQLFLPRDLFKSNPDDEKMTGSLYFYGVSLTRNYIIAAIISLSTGILFTNKTVSSHMQTLGNTPNNAVNDETNPKRKASAEEVMHMWQHGSPLARTAMQKHIDEVIKARTQAQKGMGAVRIALSLHPMLAFFIGRNGSLLPGREPVKDLVDVSNFETGYLPYDYAWGWYLHCHDQGVPGGLTKYPSPFGTCENPSNVNVYISLEDVASSGNPEGLVTARKEGTQAGPSQSLS